MNIFTRTHHKILWIFALLLGVLTHTSAETPLATLAYEGLEDFYVYQANIGQVIEANLVETGSPSRTQPADLWVSIEAPNGDVFFLMDLPQEPFNFAPQPFKTSVKIGETTHALRLPLDEISQLVGGNYTFSALYTETGKNPLTQGTDVHQSHVIKQVTIHNVTTKFEPTTHENALLAYLEDWKEADRVNLDEDGTVIITGKEKTFYAQLDEQIIAGTPPSDGLLTLTPIEDSNDDGIDDYLITYANGEQQILYYFDTGITPEPFTFTDVLYAVGDADFTSNTITIQGLKQATDVTVTGGIYTSIIKNGIDTGLTSTTVVNGDTIAVKTHSASLGDNNTRSRTPRDANNSQGITNTITLTIGEFSNEWSITTPPPIESLPDVPGVKTGETAGFEVNESGAVAYQIPIAVAPGTAGIQPKLSFTYSNHGNNGPLGVGFSLSGLSVITRCKATLAQDGFIDGVDFDGNDKFCLDGERLIAVNGTYGADGTEYRTEHTNFSKIISYGKAGDGPEKFKVWTKSGFVMEYGHSQSGGDH